MPDGGQKDTLVSSIFQRVQANPVANWVIDAIALGEVFPASSLDHLMPPQ